MWCRRQQLAQRGEQLRHHRRRQLVHNQRHLGAGCAAKRQGWQGTVGRQGQDVYKPSTRSLPHLVWYARSQLGQHAA